MISSSCKRRLSTRRFVGWVVRLFASLAILLSPHLSYAAVPLPPDQTTPLPLAISPGANQMKLGTNAAAAMRDVGVTFYTPELSHFNDRTCADGPCRNNIAGIAHRSWPLDSCVAVCNLQNKVCAEAIVMDRGPNERLTRRTIDANPALRAILGMSGGLVPATYQLISLPGKSECKTSMVASNRLPVSGIDPYNVQPYAGGQREFGGQQSIEQAYQGNQETQSGYPQAIPSQQAQPVNQPGGVQPGQYFTPQQADASTPVSSGFSNLPSIPFSSQPQLLLQINSFRFLVFQRRPILRLLRLGRVRGDRESMCNLRAVRSP